MVFRIGAEWIGLPTDVFQEVAEECIVHTLPHRRGGVLAGLVNVRGELLLCVALEILLGMEPASGINGSAEKAPASSPGLQPKRRPARVQRQRSFRYTSLQPGRPASRPGHAVKSCGRRIDDRNGAVEWQDGGLSGRRIGILRA